MVTPRDASFCARAKPSPSAPPVITAVWSGQEGREEDEGDFTSSVLSQGEAEFAHEFIRSHASFAFSPIIASEENSCVLHYHENARTCKSGDLLLLDVGAKYANYSADVTRTIPVGGRFSRRQKQVYNAVLRVIRAGITGAVPGKLARDWQREAQALMNEELLELGLLKKADIKKQTQDKPVCLRYFMQGLGHPLGIEVHDLGDTQTPFSEVWVLTVEPGIYIP